MEPEDTSLHTICTHVPSVPVAVEKDAAPPSTEGLQSAPEVPAYPAPLPDLVRTCTVQSKTSEEEAADAPQEVVEEVEVKAEEALPSLEMLGAPPPASNGLLELETDSPAAMLPPSHLETTLESPIAQPEELCLPNGLPLPAPQDPEVPAVSTTEHDDSPIAEPDIIQGSVAQTPSTNPDTVQPPVVQAVEQPTPAPQETSVDPVIQAAPAQSEVQDAVPADMVPPEAADVKEDAPVPQPTAKEEKPSSAETVSISDSTSEPVPASPPPTAEEREDIPPPQTVTPALVETMQGQWKTTGHLKSTEPVYTIVSVWLMRHAFWSLCLHAAAVSVPKKKRKIKDLNKKEAVGDLLDAFKEVCVSVPELSHSHLLNVC